MKVLKEGRNQKGWATEVDCTGSGNGGGGCGAKLLVDTSDLYLTYRSDYTGDSETYVTFTCVSCEVETDLKHVPGNVERSLPNKKDYGKELW